MNKTRHTIVAALLALATLSASVHADPVGGPRFTETRIEANDYKEFSVRLHADEATQVIVRGDGDTDLDLYVYDPDGRLVASDEDLTDRCIATFYAVRWGEYTIRVVNRDGVFNRCTIHVR